MAEDLSAQPIYAPFFGVIGASSAMIFSAMGAAYGTAKSGTGIAHMAVMRPELIMKSIIPVVMAGIVAIYGLVVAVLIGNSIDMKKAYPLSKGFLHFGAGIAVGVSGLAAGYAIGIVGDAGVRGTAQQPRLFVGMILILIFAEVLGLYGLIVAIILYTNGNGTWLETNWNQKTPVFRILVFMWFEKVKIFSFSKNKLGRHKYSKELVIILLQWNDMFTT